MVHRRPQNPEKDAKENATGGAFLGDPKSETITQGGAMQQIQIGSASVRRGGGYATNRVRYGENRQKVGRIVTNRVCASVCGLERLPYRVGASCSEKVEGRQCGLGANRSGIGCVSLPLFLFV